MNIAINTLALERGGGITHINNILSHLIDYEDNFVIITANENNIKIIENSNISYYNVVFPTDNLLLRFIYEQFILPIVLIYLHVDVLYSPTGITSLLAPCRTVTTIQNVKPYLDQTKTKKDSITNFLQRILNMLSAKRSKQTIFVSRYAQTLIRPHLNISTEKCTVVYHGVEQEMFKSPAEPFPEIKKIITTNEPYIVFISTLYKHKNHKVLIESYSELPHILREQYTLILVGGTPDEQYAQSLELLTKSKGISDSVIFLDQVDHENIPYLLSNATISVMPSEFESFGIPLIESMAAGTPVVTADTTALPEVAGDAALLFDPSNSQELSLILKYILTSGHIRNILSERGQARAENFNWKSTAEMTYAAIKQAK